MFNIITTRLMKASYVLILLLISSCSIKATENTATAQITQAIFSTSTSTTIDFTETVAPMKTTVSPIQTRGIPTLPGDEAIHTETKMPTPTSIPIPLSWIAFARGVIDPPVGIIKTDGTAFKSITTGCIFCNSVSWSPDGHWLAYEASYKPQDMGQIYVSRMDGSEPKQITFGQPRPVDVAWSPDGQYIAYVELSKDWSDADDICVVNKDTGETKKLTYTMLDEAAPAWSPDGKFIAYRQATESGQTINHTWSLMLMNKDGKNEKRITDFPIGPGRLSWSPDGKRIAFTSTEDCGDIYTIGIDGNGLKRLTDSVECAINPAWSPDGKFIVFEVRNVRGYSDVGSLAIIPADGGQMTIISLYVRGDYIYGRPDWMPVPSLQIDRTYKITETGSNLNLRDNPSIKGVALAKVTAGDLVTVLDGPVDADDYYWWKLRTEDGIEGWAVEVYGWYQPVEP